MKDTALSHPAPQPSTHVQAGVVGEDPIVTQRHVLLLPLLIEGLAAAFEENALKEKSHKSQMVLVPGTSCPLETGL